MITRYQESFKKHKAGAEEAFELLQGMYDWPLPRVPGMSTVMRLAWRIECGRSPQEAAAREYVYRWSLALNSSIFGVPHSLGR